MHRSHAIEEYLSPGKYIEEEYSRPNVSDEPLVADNWRVLIIFCLNIDINASQLW